jgi:predicted dehydrogenase
MMNWRRNSKYSGPHILEKCCHDIDLINWFTNSLPSRVTSFGGNDFFIPENKNLKDKYILEDGKTSYFDGWPGKPQEEECPFSSEKDIVDNQVAILEYRNNIRVCFQATCSNAIPERRMYFSCSEGTIIAESYSGEVQWKKIGGELNMLSMAKGSHGGGDQFIMQEFLDSIRSGSEPKCGGNEGLNSTVSALAIEDSRLKNQIIDLEPVWEKLGKGATHESSKV